MTGVRARTASTCPAAPVPPVRSFLAEAFILQPRRQQRSRCVSVRVSGRRLELLDALLGLSRHLWGGPSSLRQEMQQSHHEAWRTAMSWTAAPIKDLQDQRPLSRYETQTATRLQTKESPLTICHAGLGCLQWTGCGRAGQSGPSANPRSVTGTSTAKSCAAATSEYASVFTKPTTAPSAAETSCPRYGSATTSTAATVGDRAPQIWPPAWFSRAVRRFPGSGGAALRCHREPGSCDADQR